MIHFGMAGAFGAPPQDKPAEPRYTVKKLAGSDRAHIVDGNTGESVKRFNIFKGNGWEAAEMYADILNRRATPPDAASKGAAADLDRK